MEVTSALSGVIVQSRFGYGAKEAKFKVISCALVKDNSIFKCIIIPATNSLLRRVTWSIKNGFERLNGSAVDGLLLDINK